ncbi:MAG: sugar transporter permease [Solirubrobacteraceae bacterium]|nr:sugar transporter permease [Solirubrobacteraceae bacterium]
MQPATLSRPSAREGRRRAGRRSGLVPRYIGLAYLLPALAVYVLFLFAPFVHSVYLSFFSWDGITPHHYVGLRNYEDAIRSGEIRSGFLHAFVLIAFYALLTTAVALLLAGIMGSMRVRGLVVLRTILFLPYVIAPVVTGVAWRWLLSPSGPVNGIFRSVGLGSWAKPWLGDFDWALPSVGLIGTWMLYGLAMMLLLAGVQRIPLELYEAARIDGASAVREFFAVTLPGVRNEVTVVLVLAVTAALRNFDLIYVTTQGGPGTSTEVPSWMVYRQAFFVGDLGRASALGVLLTLLILLLSLAILRPWRRS